MEKEQRRRKESLVSAFLDVSPTFFTFFSPTLGEKISVPILASVKNFPKYQKIFSNRYDTPLEEN